MGVRGGRGGGMVERNKKRKIEKKNIKTNNSTRAFY